MRFHVNDSSENALYETEMFGNDSLKNEVVFLSTEFFDNNRCSHSGVKYRCFFLELKVLHMSKMHESHELQYCY